MKKEINVHIILYFFPGILCEETSLDVDKYGYQYASEGADMEGEGEGGRERGEGGEWRCDDVLLCSCR